MYVTLSLEPSLDGDPETYAWSYRNYRKFGATGKLADEQGNPVGTRDNPAFVDGRIYLDGKLVEEFSNWTTNRWFPGVVQIQSPTIRKGKHTVNWRMVVDDVRAPGYLWDVDASDTEVIESETRD